MARLNKYGEIDEAMCPGCGGPIKPHWVACPECGEGLKNNPQKAGSSNKTPVQVGGFLQQHSPIKPKSSNIRYICPGCGQKATASEGAILCKTCNAFVHRKCSVEGECLKSSIFFGSIYELLCPVCDEYLDVGNSDRE